MNIEQWRIIPGWDGAYSVSDQGQIRSNQRRDTMGRLVIQKIRKLTPGRRYLEVYLSNASINAHRTCHVHVLVAAAFLGPNPGGLWVLHKDDNPTNNDVDNLYYGTPANNAGDRVRNGSAPRGRSCHLSRLTECDVLGIVDLYKEGLSCIEIARRYQVGRTAISNIVQGWTWNHLTDIERRRPIS